MRKPGSIRLRLAIGLLAIGALLGLSPGVGSDRAYVGWRDAWRAAFDVAPDPQHLLTKPRTDLNADGRVDDAEIARYVLNARAIGFDHRLARSLLALVVGATLASCGATFQVLFRNPLATPYTLGVASGGALGAMLALRFGMFERVAGVPLMTLCAFFGGLAVVALVFVFARGSRRLTSNELLLAGVTLGMFCSAMMLLVQFMSNERLTFALVRWMMGSLDTVTSARAVELLPFVAPAWLVLIASAPALNQYRLGDELALSRGVRVIRLQVICIVACTLATAAVVAHCGPIGFVGLVVPQLAGRVFRWDCRILLPASLLVGGGFLIVCDFLAQSAMSAAAAVTGRRLSGTILPIGVVTALVGVPMFLIVLARRTGRDADPDR
ncbi:MAG: ABC transporter permease [Planctomycetota bacterium]|nr:MAG: ABC transporter permease [Planctomycetota bacterium]